LRAPGTFATPGGTRPKPTAEILTLPVGQSRYFANADYLEGQIDALAAHRPGLRHVIAMCAPVHEIDLSALGGRWGAGGDWRAPV